MSVIVYHGGTEIIKHPRVDAGRSNLDFGRGFYVTDIQPQAYEWAKRMSIRRGLPCVVNSYLLDKDAVLSSFECKLFTEYEISHGNNLIILKVVWQMTGLLTLLIFICQTLCREMLPLDAWQSIALIIRCVY